MRSLQFPPHSLDMSGDVLRDVSTTFVVLRLGRSIIYHEYEALLLLLPLFLHALKMSRDPSNPDWLSADNDEKYGELLLFGCFMP
jgi:hypothetical protein